MVRLSEFFGWFSVAHAAELEASRGFLMEGPSGAAPGCWRQDQPLFCFFFIGVVICRSPTVGSPSTRPLEEAEQLSNAAHKYDHHSFLRYSLACPTLSRTLYCGGFFHTLLAAQSSLLEEIDIRARACSSLVLGHLFQPTLHWMLNI